MNSTFSLVIVFLTQLFMPRHNAQPRLLKAKIELLSNLVFEDLHAAARSGVDGLTPLMKSTPSMFTLPILAELIPDAGRGSPTPWSFIAHIAPKARCLRLAFGLHLDGRVIGEQGGSCPDQLADMCGQRLQQRR